MLVSTSHNFIFIHIAKNGGTSIREVLEPYALHRDRTVATDLMARLPVRQAPEAIAYPPHRNARWARRKLGAALFDAAFSFALVHNPYDRAVSRFEFIRQTPDHHQHKHFLRMDFADFIRDEERRNRLIKRTQLSEIGDRHGNILVSRIYRFEEMDMALNDICARLSIPAPRRVPRLNVSTHRGYRDYFTPELRNRFDRLYRADLDRFGYEF